MADTNKKRSSDVPPDGDAAGGVASKSENDKLHHSQGGVTTRDDGLDAGVPMLPGSPDEPVGPEDALGVGPKRGDYTGRVGGDNYNPHQAVRQPDGTVKLVAQRPRAEDIGDALGLKGGVETGPTAAESAKPVPSGKPSKE